MLEWFVDTLLAGGEGALATINDLVFSLPAPGEPGTPATWGSPEGGLWGGVATAMSYTRALAVVMLVFAAVATGLETDEYARRQGWRRCGLATAAVVLGLVVPGFVLHAGNAVIDAVQPGAEEFFTSAGGLENLGVGIGLGLFLGIAQTGTIGVGLAVLALERVLVYLTVYLFPLACACYAYRGFIRSLGQTILYTFGVVVFLKIMQALLLRLLFELPLVTGDAATLVGLVLQIGGLFFVLIYFPKTMLDHANDAASVSLGMSAAAREGGAAFDRGGERARALVRDRYETYRGGDADAGRPTVGQVGATGDSSSTSSTAATTGGVPSGHGHGHGYGAGHTGGDAPTPDGGPRSPADGLDVNEWDRHRERFDDDLRGFQ